MTINHLENPLEEKTELTAPDKIISIIFGHGRFEKITDPIIITKLRSKHKLYEGSIEYLKLEIKIISIKNEYHLNPLIHLQYVTDSFQYICLTLNSKEKIYFYYEIFCKDFFMKTDIMETDMLETDLYKDTVFRCNIF